MNKRMHDATTTSGELDFGKYDEAELSELVDQDVNGGTGWSCALVTLASAIGCPTTACSDSC